jgi:hypothetical protein
VKLLVGALAVASLCLNTADAWARDESGLIGPVRVQDLLLLAVLGTLAAGELLLVSFVLSITSAADADGRRRPALARGDRAESSSEFKKQPSSAVTGETRSARAAPVSSAAARAGLGCDLRPDSPEEAGCHVAKPRYACRAFRNLSGSVEDYCMRTRPLPVTVAAFLLGLESVAIFPWPWWYLFPGAEEPPAFFVAVGIVLGSVGLVVVMGLWLLKRWSLPATLVVAGLNLLLAAPGLLEDLPVALQAVIAVTAIVPVLIVVLVGLPTSRRALTAT